MQHTTVVSSEFPLPSVWCVRHLNGWFRWAVEIVRDGSPHLYYVDQRKGGCTIFGKPGKFESKEAAIAQLVAA